MSVDVHDERFGCHIWSLYFQYLIEERSRLICVSFKVISKAFKLLWLQGTSFGALVMGFLSPSPSG